MPPSVVHDGTPQWVGEFPPAGHVDPEPHVGMPATVAHAPVLRRAVVTAVERGRVQVRVEYGKRPMRFTRRKDGEYRSEGDRGSTASRLVLGIAASNLKTYKRWFSDKELAAGPIRADDIAYRTLRGETYRDLTV